LVAPVNTVVKFSIFKFRTSGIFASTSQQYVTGAGVSFNALIWRHTHTDYQKIPGEPNSVHRPSRTATELAVLDKVTNKHAPEGASTSSIEFAFFLTTVQDYHHRRRGRHQCPMSNSTRYFISDGHVVASMVRML
jgi:hypothetical protein